MEKIGHLANEGIRQMDDVSRRFLLYTELRIVCAGGGKPHASAPQARLIRFVGPDCPGVPARRVGNDGPGSKAGFNAHRWRVV